MAANTCGRVLDQDFAVDFRRKQIFDELASKTAPRRLTNYWTIQSNSMLFAVARHVMSTCPESVERAPYFAAFVDNSCMTAARASAVFGFSMVCGPHVKHGLPHRALQSVQQVFRVPPLLKHWCSLVTILHAAPFASNLCQE